MDGTTIALGICALYLLASLVMGILPGLRVSHSVTGYVAGDRAMNTLILYFVIGASIFSSFAFLGGPGWAYSRGMAALFIIAYGTLGMVPLYFTGPRARRVGERFGLVTQAEMLAHRFDSKPLSVLLAVLSVAVFIPYLTLQMEGAGYILSTISDGRVSPELGAAIPYLVVLVYVLFSGVMGVGWTNTFQGIFMMAIAWFLGLWLPYKLYGGVGAMFEQILASDQAGLLTAPGRLPSGAPWDWWGYGSAVLVSAIGFSVWPHFFMKSFAAKSERVMRKTVVLYPTFQLFLVPILLIGFAGILAFPGVTPADRILPFMLTQLKLSPVLVGLVCAGTLAASMSSGDAMIHAAASIGIRDGVAPLARHRLSDQRERFWIRVLAVAVTVISYLFAVNSQVSLVSLLLAAYGGVAQIFPLVFAAFYWPRATGAGALAGLVGGITVNTFFLLAPGFKPLPMHEGIYGLIANLVLLVAVSLCTAPQSQELRDAYCDR
jgi:SSS family solute:Na+ symporter